MNVLFVQGTKAYGVNRWNETRSVISLFFFFFFLFLFSLSLFFFLFFLLLSLALRVLYAVMAILRVQ